MQEVVLTIKPMEWRGNCETTLLISVCNILRIREWNEMFRPRLNLYKNNTNLKNKF